MAETNAGVGRDPTSCSRTRRFQQKVAGTAFYKDSVNTESGLDYVLVPQHTSVERAALSPATGWHIFETTLNKPLWYDGTNWVDGIGNVIL